MARGRAGYSANGKASKSNGANLGFEATLWAAADKMRNNMDAGECHLLGSVSSSPSRRPVPMRSTERKG